MEEIENKSKIPNFLMFLLVLTSVNVVFVLFGQVLSIGDAPPTDLAEVVEDALYNADVNLDDIPNWIMNDLWDFLANVSANYGLINAIDMAYYLILVPAVIMMFKLRLTGYYIYVVTQVVGVAYIPLAYGFNAISWMMVGMYAFTALLFIVLYTLNKKHLS